MQYRRSSTTKRLMRQVTATKNDSYCWTSLYYIFFFQAEDGIRDYKVTGVQTCALPVAIEKMLVAEVLQPFHAKAAAPARQDRAKKDSVALLDARRQDRARPDLLDDSHRLVAQDPGRRGTRVAVEECSRVGAADPAGLDAKKRTFGIDARLRRFADLDRVDARHESRLHRAATVPSSCC